MKISRRHFTKIIGITGSLGAFFVSSCKRFFDTGKPEYAITDEQLETLRQVHEHLFPQNETSPGASSINSVGYVQKVLLDPQVEDYEKRLILYGIFWTEETSKKLFSKPFTLLSKLQKEDVVKNLVSYDKGESWISNNISYIIESLLSDPIYGGNTNSSGWKWLKHQPGYPRPDELHKYPYL